MVERFQRLAEGAEGPGVCRVRVSGGFCVRAQGVDRRVDNESAWIDRVAAVGRIGAMPTVHDQEECPLASPSWTLSVIHNDRLVWAGDGKCEPHLWFEPLSAAND